VQAQVWAFCNGMRESETEEMLVQHQASAFVQRINDAAIFNNFNIVSAAIYTEALSKN
jgi:hypothetical protein